MLIRQSRKFFLTSFNNISSTQFFQRIVKMSSSNLSSSEPLYGLNEQLSIDTPEPPVPMARAWAASYPSKSSPFLSGDQTIQPILNLAQGVPGHEPHKKLLECMEEERIKNPMETHGYGNVFGHDLLRKALANDINRMYRGNVEENEIAITSGANLAAAITFHSIAKPGEGIILPTPWYFNHQMTLTSLGIKPIPLQTSSPSFKPDPNQLKNLLQEYSNSDVKIKGVVLVTPNNPTGSIYPSELVNEFVNVCRSHKIALIIDETYRDFLLEGDEKGIIHSEKRQLTQPHKSFEKEDWRDCLISIHSFSKSYAIPGHRLGAIISHSSLLINEQKDEKSGKIIKKFGNFAKSLDNMQICPPRTDTQRAIARCIEDYEHQEWRNSIANDLAKRRKTFFNSLKDQMNFDEIYSKLQIKQVDLFKDIEKDHTLISPQDLGWKGLSSGAYYAYVRHPFEQVSSLLVARGLSALVGVVVLPGSFFRPKEDEEGDRDLRFSIANVESSKLETLSARLILFTYLWKIKGAGWGL